MKISKRNFKTEIFFVCEFCESVKQIKKKKKNTLTNGYQAREVFFKPMIQRKFQFRLTDPDDRHYFS